MSTLVAAIHRLKAGREFPHVAGPKIERCDCWIDQLAAFGCVFFRKEARVGDLDEIRVAEIGVAIGHGEFYGFDRGVDIVGRVQPHRLQVVAFQNIKSEEFGGALDEAERGREQSIFEWEGVRNPFVDHPEWIDAIADF